MDIGILHVQLVHFPIALSLAAVLGDILWTWRRKDFYRHAGFYCLLLAAVAAIPTFITGDEHLDRQQYIGETLQIAETHATLATITLGVVLAAAGLRAARRNRPQGWWLVAYVVLISAAAVMISITGHWGGMVTFGPEYLSGLFA